MSNDSKTSISKVENITKSLSDLTTTVNDLEHFETELTGLSNPPSIPESVKEHSGDYVASIINNISSDLENLSSRISQVIIRLKETLI